MARVMIVEDEPITAADLEQKVAALGHTVAAACDSGEEVLALAPALAPDLVLMDIRLRGAMNGIEVAQRLRAQSDVPIVFLTAFADKETVDRACETQPFGYVLKPFTERAIAAAVQVALARASSERTLAQRERFMSAALRRAGEALVAVDERGQVRFVNEHAERLLKVMERDVLGEDARSLLRFVPTDAGDSAHPIDAALRDGRMSASESRGLLSPGSHVPVVVAYSAAPVVSGGGAKAGAVLVFHEPPAREAARGAEPGEALGTLPLQLSHEINNPLTYNLGALRLAMKEIDQLRAMSSLRAGPADPSLSQLEARLLRIQGLLEGAHEGATRIADVVRELGPESRASREAAPIHPVELLDLAIGLSGVAARSGLRVQRQAGPVPIIRGDRWELSSVLAFAIQHATEALDPSATEANTLALSADTDARGWVELRVAGRGRRALEAPPPRPPGSAPVEPRPGLTMTLAEHVVGRHGGELSVHEEADGRELTLRLPPMSVTALAPRAEASGSPRRGSVLVVDDEPMIRRILEITLQPHHDVKAVSSAASALAVLERGDAFDAILCDLSMPGMDGQDLYERLLTERPEIAARMIFMSGGATTERGAGFLDAMAARRIHKPFQTDHLLRMLDERVLARGRVAAPARA